MAVLLVFILSAVPLATIALIVPRSATPDTSLQNLADPHLLSPILDTLLHAGPVSGPTIDDLIIPLFNTERSTNPTSKRLVPRVTIIGNPEQTTWGTRHLAVPATVGNADVVIQKFKSPQGPGSIGTLTAIIQSKHHCRDHTLATYIFGDSTTRHATVLDAWQDVLFHAGDEDLSLFEIVQDESRATESTADALLNAYMPDWERYRYMPELWTNWLMAASTIEGVPGYTYSFIQDPIEPSEPEQIINKKSIGVALLLIARNMVLTIRYELNSNLWHNEFGAIDGYFVKVVLNCLQDMITYGNTILVKPSRPHEQPPTFEDVRNAVSNAVRGIFNDEVPNPRLLSLEHYEQVVKYALDCSRDSQVQQLDTELQNMGAQIGTQISTQIGTIDTE